MKRSSTNVGMICLFSVLLLVALLLLCNSKGDKIKPQNVSGIQEILNPEMGITIGSGSSKMASVNGDALDWTKLPKELSYLAKPAEKYGKYQFEDNIVDFLTAKMTAAEKEELISLSEHFGKDQDLIQQWLDNYKITLHEESSLVYFTMCLVGTGCDMGILQKDR